MSNAVRQRVTKIKEGAKAKTKLSGWVLPRQASSFAEEGTWSVFPFCVNKTSDLT